MKIKIKDKGIRLNWIQAIFLIVLLTVISFYILDKVEIYLYSIDNFLQDVVNSFKLFVYLDYSVVAIISIFVGSSIKYRLSYEKNKYLNLVLYWTSILFNIGFIGFISLYVGVITLFVLAPDMG